ncbi:3-oxoacyl-[acyl-carrier-protein] reductase FabG-like [Sabethes cyaneus]|uniref:3-oxoacyl-[acyl-carrier-protein] reductase FabG-like n=1 Tax=Sabethes cyaneus TaxID=53552 RepID=UPI00237E3779|nr:3-oxoacyl-[acyl-carrier-protein] reductase FabG-like [Sabethes cyaneus]
MNFSGKVVLITGASSGIGAATALYFSKLKATLALVGLNIDQLQQVASKCETAGGSKPMVTATDLTDESGNTQLIAEVIKTFGKLDVLVNNAGKGSAGTILSTSLANYDDIMRTNVRSVFQLTQLAVPHLIRTKGNIVNVSSVAGRRSFPDFLAYCISKAAIDQLTRCAALELAPNQVRVNAVNPGVIVTNFHRQAGMKEEAYKAFLKRCEKTHALGRVGQDSEVASAIAFLAGDTASFITGLCLFVDGGKHIMCPR